MNAASVIPLLKVMKASKIVIAITVVILMLKFIISSLFISLTPTDTLLLDSASFLLAVHLVQKNYVGTRAHAHAAARGRMVHMYVRTWYNPLIFIYRLQ